MNAPYSRADFEAVYTGMVNEERLDTDIADTEWGLRRELIEQVGIRSVAFRYQDERGIDRYVSRAQARALVDASREIGVDATEEDFLFGTDTAMEIIGNINMEYRELRRQGKTGKEAGALIATMFFGSP